MILEPNFKIPATYSKFFCLGIGDFKYVIIVEDGKILSGQIGVEPASIQSKVLDYIEETMARIRYECEKLND